jgi:membrane protein DedA with SNARE-associated domain
LEKERVLFIPVAYIQALKRLFERYGYYVIVANRFLGVKRIGVSFFAGLSGCSAWKTVLCAALSAAMWSGLLLYAGLLLGASWKGVLQYVSLYGWIMFAVLVSVLIVIVIKNRRSEISSASAGAIAE